MGCILSAASCRKWWLEEILESNDYQKDEANLADSNVIFLPYLTGERSPHNDVNARGAFINLSATTTRGEMSKAILEGVAFALKDCLEIAKKNALDNNANIDFILSDCLDNITNDDFDIVVSNPPYINKDNYVSKRVLDNEPHLALFAEDKGLAIYKKIFLQIRKFSFLKAVFFEISPDLKSNLENIKSIYLPQFNSQYLLDINKFIRFAIYLKY